MLTSPLISLHIYSLLLMSKTLTVFTLLAVRKIATLTTVASFPSSLSNQASPSHTPHFPLSFSYNYKFSYLPSSVCRNVKYVLNSWYKKSNTGVGLCSSTALPALPLFLYIWGHLLIVFWSRRCLQNIATKIPPCILREFVYFGETTGSLIRLNNKINNIKINSVLISNDGFGKSSIEKFHTIFIIS